MLNLRLRKNKLNTWSILSFIIITLIILPSLNIIIELVSDPTQNWGHIKEYLLKDYTINSLKLITYTGFLTMIIGTSLAWIISVYDFPLRNLFKWALILPLAIPPYVGAYTYNGLLNYTGVIQSSLRNFFNLSLNQKYFDIMGAQGAVFIFTVLLFPYVFAITRAFMEKQSASLIETARTLGRSPLEIFIYVILPISRGAIVGGVSLVILEVLNDYGLVKYFGIPTFSTAIFKTWFGLGDINSAVRLSAILLLIVFSILGLEKIFRGRKQYSPSTSKIRPIVRYKLEGKKSFFAFSYCLSIFAVGFLIPAAQLMYWSLISFKHVISFKFLSFVLNSVVSALIASCLIILFAVVVANNSRISQGFASKLNSKIIVLGYSIPGAVIAIGVIVLFLNIDNNFYWLYQIINPQWPKLLLSTSITMLIFAYVIRFLAIGYNSVEAGFQKVGKKYFEASRTLGMNISQTFIKVDLPMMKTALISGFILVFVDILKELPLTLLLRPFNFETLATKAFEYANDEMIHEASIASLLIILVSSVSIYFFNMAGEREV
ncbi:MAG: ABC transporter permease [Bacillota bacterium]